MSVLGAERRAWKAVKRADLAYGNAAGLSRKDQHTAKADGPIACPARLKPIEAPKQTSSSSGGELLDTTSAKLSHTRMWGEPIRHLRGNRGAGGKGRPPQHLCCFAQPKEMFGTKGKPTTSEVTHGHEL